MARQIIVRAPSGLGLVVDYAAGTVHAAPRSSDDETYLVIEPKPGAAEPTPKPAEASGGGAGEVSYPLPPIIMSLRTRNALRFDMADAPHAHATGPVKLRDIASRLAGLDENEIRVLVVGPSDGG